MDWVPALGLLVCVLASLFGRTEEAGDGFTLLKYHNADAKFLGNRIITSVDEGIQILDLSGQVVKSYDGLSASWIYVEEGSGEAAGIDPGQGERSWHVAYSNHAKETHILSLSKDCESVDDRVALWTDTLAIDPILVRAGEAWLLTNTEIEGTINNPDPGGDNGVYTVKLYRSEDLEHWEPVGDIISRKQNLEDGDIRYVDGKLYYFFEREDYDKGPSAVCVMISEDMGESWSEPKELLPAKADNEMASCEPTDEGWRLYVSSDCACVGESYQGASVYYSDYTEDFEPIRIYQLSTMPDNQAVRLYESKELDGRRYFLFARNFLTDCDFLLRTIEEESEGG